MKPCPPREQFQRLLADQLSATEERALETHVELCPVCLGTLEELTAALPERSANKPLTWQGPQTTEAASERFLRRLREHPSPCSGHPPQGTLPSETVPAAVPLPRVAGYEILEKLGHGGMGVVYRARQTGLNRIVALKMILAGAHADPTALARFRAEAKAIAQLQHPHIVQIYEIGEAGGLPYLSLEYVEGGTLAKQLTGTPQPPDQAAELVELLARAVHYAHEHGIIHRDLKPANILLSEEKGRMRKDGTKNNTSDSSFIPQPSPFVPKITDFGLAKRLESIIGVAASDVPTPTGVGVGTPRYMAPEQAGVSSRDTPIGPAADVYSLGAILYELLVGQPLFQGDNPFDLLMRVLHEEPVPPRHLQRAVPRDLETICLKALSKAPGRRYQTARELAEDLRRYLKGEPIQARPVGVGERIYRWGQRHPASAGLLGVSALAALALVGALLAWFNTVQSNTAKRIAERAKQAEEKQRQQAEMLRDRLLESTTEAVPGIVKAMAPYRCWVDRLLKEAYRQALENNDSRKQLHTSLALLPVDSGQVEYLYARMLKDEPQEVKVIREALFDHKQGLIEPLWALLVDRKTNQDQRFRASCALAAFAPDDPRWEKVSEDVAATLVIQKPFVIAQWTDALKRVERWLIPPLADFLADEKRSVSERGLIASVYGTYGADLPGAYARLEKRLAEQSEPDASVKAKVVLAKRQANIGVALMVMDRGAKVWPLLKHQTDPTLRSFLIERLGPAGVDPKVLISRLDEEKEASVKRAILLSLGEVGLDRLSQAERLNFLPSLLQLYGDDPDPGIHGAAEWLLQQWQASNRLKEIDKVLASGKVEGKRQWYVNRHGQTMMIVSRPSEFWMGEGLERQRRQIDHSFAVASKEVTMEQFLRFRKEHQFDKADAPTMDCPVHRATWYEAAEYCNWLSEQEGIPRDQWCFLPNLVGRGTMAPNYLQRTGYRLPTEDEWEYACRAGAETLHSFGEAEEVLDKYAWHYWNSFSKSHPVGLLKPNDLGLYDMHGNAREWTQDVFKPYVRSEGTEDREQHQAAIWNARSRVWRGGAFDDRAMGVRSAVRYRVEPTDRAAGFRPVRTFITEIAFAVPFGLSPRLGTVLSEPPATVAQPKLALAYIYDYDKGSADGFKKLLDEAGFSLHQIHIEAVEMTDFTSYAAILIGSDTEQAWKLYAKAVDRAKKPILGLGRGGGDFFDDLKLSIGAGMGMGSNKTAVLPVNPSKSRFWSSSKVSTKDGKPITVYEKTTYGDITIYLPNPGENVLLIAQEENGATYYPIVQHGSRYVLWGFTGPPAQMTRVGRELFIATCCYTAALTKSAGGEKPAEKETKKTSLGD